MKIRNYTSTVPVEKSIAAIERLLVDAGATHIVRSYVEGRLAAFVFTINVLGRPITFKLPANPAAVKRTLEKGLKQMRAGTQQRILEQAERTAWKLLHDWVHVQISLIQMGQAEPMQVFLPYVYDALKEETLYERYKGNGFKALESGK